MDGSGLDVEAGIEKEPGARLACVTPSHQYPLGVTMTLGRRLALLRWASRTGAWVIEDDYDSEYRYTGRPLEALQGLDGSAEGCVIYVGTFSRSSSPPSGWSTSSSPRTSWRRSARRASSPTGTRPP